MKVFVTRKIPERGISMLKEKGYEVDVSEKDGVLTKDELAAALRTKPYDAVLCLLTDTIDKDAFNAAAPSVKIFSNYAVGFNNIDVPEAKARGIMITNTPGVLRERVPNPPSALFLGWASVFVEENTFTRRHQKNDREC